MTDTNTIIQSGKISILSIVPIDLERTKEADSKKFRRTFSGVLNKIKNIPQYITYIEYRQDCAISCGGPKEKSAIINCTCFDVVDGFVQIIDGQGGKRYYLGTTFFCWRGNKIRLDIFFKLFPERNICIVCFNVDISDLKACDVVALRHLIESQVTVSDDQLSSVFYTEKDVDNVVGEDTICWGALYSLFYKLIASLSPTCKWYQQLLKQRQNRTLIENITNFTPVFNQQIIIELQDVGDFALMSQDAHGWAIDNAQLVYSILSGDEAVGFITESLAKERISLHWSSREFVDVIAFGKNVFVLNAKHTSNRGLDYIKFQKEWSQRYKSGEKRERYFTCRPCIAGFDHGVLQAVERNMIIRYYYDFIDKQEKRDGRQLNEHRQKLLSFISVSSSAIDEVKELFGIIENASGTENCIRSVRTKLDVQNEEMNINYQTKNNTIIFILTILSLTVAICAIQRETILFEWVPIWRKIFYILGIIVTLTVVIYMVVKLLDLRSRKGK